jgi:glyoxylase-like metal-dependent hydrolase (beta-lactamase superfamily II)
MRIDRMFENPHSGMGRRAFLGSTLLAAATGFALGQDNKPAAAAAAAVKPARNPFTYHFKIGEFDAWTISDGNALIRNATGLMWPQEDRPQMMDWLKSHGERLDGIPLYINILVVKIGTEYVIFDAGFGKVSNPELGWVAQGLKDIGIEPSQVTAGFLSHGHSDHFGGFVVDGKPYFPNAAFHYLQEEYDFWHSPEPDFSKSHRDKGELPGLVRTVRSNFEILKPQCQPLKTGDSLFNGAVIVELAPGHTDGHAVFRIKSGDDELLHIVDLAHHHGYMFQNPHWTIAFDHDPDLSVVTRRKIFAQAAAQGTRCYGFHLPWPGLGHIVKPGAEESYVWHQERWSWGS